MMRTKSKLYYYIEIRSKGQKGGKPFLWPWAGFCTYDKRSEALRVLERLIAHGDVARLWRCQARIEMDLITLSPGPLRAKPVRAIPSEKGTGNRWLH